MDRGKFFERNFCLARPPLFRWLGLPRRKPHILPYPHHNLPSSGAQLPRIPMPPFSVEFGPTTIFSLEDLTEPRRPAKWVSKRSLRLRLRLQPLTGLSHHPQHSNSKSSASSPPPLRRSESLAPEHGHVSMGSFTKGLKHCETRREGWSLLSFAAQARQPFRLGPNDGLVATLHSHQIQALMARGVTLCSDIIKWPCYYSVA